ncbi:MAG: hypothetical protein WBS33_03850 [Verrucomicrobiia bacterium]
MKYLSAIFILLCASFALGQGSYQAFPVVTANGLAIAGANVALCSTTLPTTATPCGGSTLEATYTDITLGTACALSPTILGPTYGIGCTNPGMADGLGMVRLYATANPNGTVYHYQTYGQGILVPDVEPIFFPGWGLPATTQCAAAGSAANPSVASCSGAQAGLFSCATNASTGTCVVHTTAVTANSTILIQPDASLGAALSVTCNTTADSGLTSPRIAARNAGTSFTLNLGTFTSNPECFSYSLIN